MDDGLTWQVIPTPSDIGSLSGFVAVGKHVFAVDAGGGVARSDDAGLTWTRSGLGGSTVGGLAVAHDTLFASVGAYGDVGPAGVRYSPDLGETWKELDASFTGRVGPLQILDGRLFAGTFEQSVWAMKLGCIDAP
jgi:photosystem II stability/assembly factor-like uncharacterized protein